jgi:hypothetical protein
MLTSLGVILAAVTIAVGLAAIWGYNQITTAAAEKAEIAVGVAIKQLLEKMQLQDMINIAVSAKIEEASDQVYKDLAVTRPDVADQQNQAIAEEYPPEKGES